MRRNFHYHPENEKAVVTAVIKERLAIADVDQLSPSVYMPKEDSEGKPTLGWWIQEWEPSDFMTQTGLFFIPAAVHQAPTEAR